MKFVGYDKDEKPIFKYARGQSSAPVRALVGFFYSNGFARNQLGQRFNSLLKESKLKVFASNFARPIKFVIAYNDGFILSSDKYYGLWELDAGWSDDKIANFCEKERFEKKGYYDRDYFQSVDSFYISYGKEKIDVSKAEEVGQTTKEVDTKEACIEMYKKIISPTRNGESLVE